MADQLKVDICVIGGGAGGLAVAAAAAQMGASVALIEKAKMGGDCLNYGCVPSKALLAAGHAAESVRRAIRFGVAGGQPAVDAKAVHGHVHGSIAALAPHDSQERFEGLGVKVIRAPARFTGRRQVEAGDFRVTARRLVVATGSSPFAPPISGLEGTPYFTNENIFDLGRIPNHLLIVGGGPIGMEMAQAFRRLGAEVTVLEMFTIMPNDDPELVEVVRGRLAADGVDIREGVNIAGVEKAGDGVRMIMETHGVETKVEGSHLLIAAGRRANVGGLDLEKAGIAYSPKGIEVDARLRTSNKKVFAIGDVAGGFQFTHVAEYHAGIVIRNALFRIPAKAKTGAVPWVTYTDPELAQVGLTEERAKERQGEIRVLRWPFADTTRARTDGETDGLVKAITSRKGRILGAGIAGPRAGELIHSWVLAMSNNLKIGALAGMIAPYPTFGEASKRAAGGFFTPLLFSERARKIVRVLGLFG